MDNEKDFNENYGLHVDGGKQCDTSELEEENRPSHVTVDEKETVGGDANGHLLRHEKEPEVLESVHKYANRIKSFLGWEPNEEEQKEIEKERETASDDVECNKTNEVECSSFGDSTNKESNYESLMEEEKDKNVAQSQENEKMNEQLNHVKLNSSLQTNPMNDCNISNNSPKSETSGTKNKAVNPDIEDGNLSSGSVNIPSVDNSKLVTAATDLVEIKSESDIDRDDNTTPEMEEIKQPDLDNSNSSSIGHENENNEILVKENKDSYTENIDITDQKENRTVSDSEISSLKEKETFPEDDINIHLEQSTSSTIAETKENGSCEENICQNDGNEDNIQLYENLPEKYNVKKTYMDEIRRLSIDIVKDVIESARNSVQEILVNKSDQGTTENENINLVVNGSKILETENIDDKLNVTNQFGENEPTQSLHNELNESKYSINVTKEIEGCKEFATNEESICGFGSFHPKWIQKYATPRIFLIFFSTVGIINGTYYAYFVSIISTLEKRYAFQTKVSGTLLLADEITPVILGVIVGYLGGRTHRPRMVTLGMLCSAACCFISALPYLFYGSVKHLIIQSVKNVTDPELCDTEVRMENCDVDDRPPTLSVIGIFILASFLRGFATLSYYVIGVSFMDDNIRKKNTPMYLAIAMALRLLGPLVGFLMSSAFLKIYENPFEDPGFGPDDPRWIGAWWIGFFLQGILLVIFTLPIALFPKRLPSQKKVEKLPSETNKENIRETLRGLVAALKRLGKNPIFILMVCNTTMKIYGHFGHSIMLPKYMENQFRLSAADASLFSGATSIFCLMISTVLGGFLIWKYRPRIKMLLGGMVTSEIILCLGFLVLMIPRCEPTDMLHFGVDDEGLILNSVCNRNCDCSTKSFTPFCGPEGKTTYFSPCYAGCTQEITSGMMPKTQTVFGNCSCVSGTNSPEANTTKIIEGFCPDENCWSKTLAYLIILFILLTISNTFTVAHTMILLRSVHPADKSFALGTFETFICLFGFIPFPVIFGSLVDSACLVWEKSCGETGNCWFYDMEKYRYLLHGASAAFCSLSTVCLITLYFLSPRVRDLYVEEDHEEERIDDIKLDTVSGSVTKL